jgi:hypothetical protein
MDMSSMEEDQVVHDATQAVGNNGASHTMMGFYDVLRIIEQILAHFKHYIEVSEIGMAQVPSMVQAPQALPVVQASYIREPKFIMPKKFDGTRSKFCGFVQQVNLFLRVHPSRYPNDSTQVAFKGSLLLGNALSWFASFLEKRLLVLHDMAQFEAFFTAAFVDSDREKVAETKMQSLRQLTRCTAIYAIEFQQLTCDLEWNDKAFINRFRYGLKDDVKDLLITMPKTLQKFIIQAITCNNWLFERRQEKRFSWGNKNHTMISTSSTLKKNASGPKPMQIDTAQCKSLSQGENDRCCREGLCFYCGSSKHSVQLSQRN